MPISRRLFTRSVPALAATTITPPAASAFAEAPADEAAVQTVVAGAPAGSLTDVRGIRVGHATHSARPTGCTVILFDEPVTAGADYDGSAPGELLGVMLQPVSPLERIHGILLTGGGPMGLEAAAEIGRAHV